MQQGLPASPGCSAVTAVGDIGQPSEPISFEPKPLERNIDLDASGQQKVSDPTTLEAGCSGVQCADLPPDVAEEDAVDDGCNNEGYNDDFESDDDKPLLSSDADSNSEGDLDLRTSAGEPEICRRAVAGNDFGNCWACCCHHVPLPCRSAGISSAGQRFRRPWQYASAICATVATVIGKRAP